MGSYMCGCRVSSKYLLKFGIAEMEFSKRSFLIFQDNPQQSFVWRLLWVFERFSTNLVAESESRDQCLLVGFYL
jgi:hypothetical protein